MEELLALLGLGGGGLMVGNAYNKLGNIGDTAWQKSKQIGAEAAGQSNFTGYGVTGMPGSANVGADGSTQFNLSHDQLAQAQRFAQTGQSMLSWQNPLAQYSGAGLNNATTLANRAGQDIGGRDQAIYDRIRAMQMPEEARAQTSLNSQLAAQGRTGVTTAQFGGTPEQLAMSKAIEEAKNAAAYNSIGLGQSQQQQDSSSAAMLSQSGQGAAGTQGDLAQLYAMMQYAPQSAMLDMFNAGGQAYGYKDISQRQGASLNAEAQMGGLETQLGAGLGQANLMGGIGSVAIGGGMSMLGSAINNGSSSIWDFLKKAGGAVYG